MAAPDGTARHLSLLPLSTRISPRALLVGAFCVALTLPGCESADESPLGPDPRIVVLSIDEARELLRNQKFEEATEALRPHVSVPNPTTQALVLYGRALMGSQRWSLAVWPLQRASEREDAPPGVPRMYAQALVAGGDELTAVDYTTRYLEEVDPENLLLRDLRAKAYEVSLDYERAVDDLEILAAETPEHAAILERLLNTLIQIEDWDGARERIREIATILERTGAAQDSRTVHCATASRFEKSRGEMEAAEQWLDECQEEFPADPNLAFAREELFDATERSDEATRMLAALVEEYPKRQILRQGYAARLGRLGRLDDAEAVLQAGVDADGHMNSWLALANLRLARRDLPGTVEALDAAIEAAMGQPADDPGLEWGRMNPDSRFGIADVYVRTGEFDRAERIASSLDEDEPSMAALIRARMKLEQGQPREALDAFLEAFRTFASNPAARYLAGRAAVEVGEFDLALDLYQDALRSDPHATDAGLVLGQMLVAEGRVNWAIDSISFLIARAGHEPFALRLLARAAAAGGFHEYAKSVRDELVGNLEWAGLAHADHAGDLSLLAGKKEARAYLEEVDALFEPSHVEAFWAWIALARGTPDEDAAIARLARFEADHPDSFEAALLRGRLAVQRGEIEASIESLGRATEINPLHAVALTEYGLALLEAERLDEAIAVLDRAAELEQRDPRPAFAAAEALFEADRLDEAEARLEALLIPHPWHGRAAMMLIDIAKRRGDRSSDEVHMLARRATRYHRFSGGRAFYERGLIELERGDPESALVQLERAVALHHPSADARVAMARALDQLGRDDEARGQLERALDSEELTEREAASALLDSLGREEEKG